MHDELLRRDNPGESETYFVLPLETLAEIDSPIHSLGDSPGDPTAYYSRLYSSNFACLTSVDIIRLIEARSFTRN